MKPLLQHFIYGKQMRSGLAVAICFWLAGCAGPFLNAGDAKPPFRDPAMTMENARGIIVPGQSTKGDVAAALGKATVVRFDSGFEVWVYRDTPAGSSASSSGAEFVVLFTPSGLVKKIRTRLPSHPRG